MSGYSGTNVFYSVFDSVSQDFVVVGCETSGTTTATNQLIDVTCKHSNNFREVSSDNGIRTQDETIELLVFDEAGIRILKNAVGTGLILDFRETNGFSFSLRDFKAKVSSITQTNPNGAAATFSVTLNSSSDYSGGDKFQTLAFHVGYGSTVSVFSAGNGDKIGEYPTLETQSVANTRVSGVLPNGDVVTSWSSGAFINQTANYVIRVFNPKTGSESAQTSSSFFGSLFTIDINSDLYRGSRSSNEGFTFYKYQGIDLLNNTESIIPFLSGTTDISIDINGNIARHSGGVITIYDGFTSTELENINLPVLPALPTSIDFDGDGNLYLLSDTGAGTISTVTVIDQTGVILNSFDVPRLQNGFPSNSIAFGGRLIQ